jgi:hypothetical protein
VPIGGAQAIGRVLRELGPETKVAGLCDAGEQRGFERALGPGRFFVCDPDLEGELIRALGVARVEAIAEANGDLRAFRTLQKQSAWLGRPPEEQLRRWMGSGGRRKIRYASLLVDALPLEEIPRPLTELLAYVRA